MSTPDLVKAIADHNAAQPGETLIVLAVEAAKLASKSGLQKTEIKGDAFKVVIRTKKARKS